MKSGIRWLLWASLLVPGIAGAVPLATPDEDRRAKQAVPAPGTALLYVYRTETGAKVSPTVVLNGRELGALGPRTYFMLAIPPGRADLRISTRGSETLSIRVQEGRIYFVHLEVTTAGEGRLVQTSYGRGRQDVHAGRLAREGKPVAAATPPAPARRAETRPAEPSPATTEPPAAGRAGFNLIVKGGGFSLASGSQTIVATPLTFDTGSTALGIEGEWITSQGWAFGAEYLSHGHGYTSPGGSGDLTAVVVALNVKKYFRYGATVQPYVGAGFGTATASLSGNIIGSASGFAAQAMAGLAVRGETFGFYSELKYQSATPEDANGQSVDIGGMGIFLGVSARF